jgi:hypothetical protein
VRVAATRGLVAAALALGSAGVPLFPAVGWAQLDEDAGSDPNTAPDAAPLPYGSSDLSRRRGDSVDPHALRAEPAAPAFGAEAKDPGDLRGTAKPLDAVARPPIGRTPGAEEPPGAEESPDADAEASDLAPEGLAPLRLRRRPDVAAAAERTLAERLCTAERDVAFAQREHTDAVRAYKRARRDGYPRGEARALVVEHRDLTARRLARAEAERAALLAEADSQRLDPADTRCRRGL